MKKQKHDVRLNLLKRCNFILLFRQKDMKVCIGPEN